MEKTKRNKILKIAIILLAVIGLSVGIFFICKAVGITDINTLQTAIQNCGAWGVVAFIFLRVLMTIFMCFVPAISMIFDLLCVALYGANITAFLISLCSIFITSIVLDAMGRFGGSKLIIKIVGQEDYEKALNLIDTKGVVYTPVMYLLPIFPDDAICMVNGMLKTKWWVHYIEILVCRGIGCLTVVFGLNLLPQDLMSNLSPFNWEFVKDNIFRYLEMLTVIAIWLIAIFKLAGFVDKKLSKRLARKKEQSSL